MRSLTLFSAALALCATVAGTAYAAKPWTNIPGDCTPDGAACRWCPQDQSATDPVCMMVKRGEDPNTSDQQAAAADQKKPVCVTFNGKQNCDTDATPVATAFTVQSDAEIPAPRSITGWHAAYQERGEWYYCPDDKQLAAWPWVPLQPCRAQSDPQLIAAGMGNLSPLRPASPQPYQDHGCWNSYVANTAGRGRNRVYVGMQTGDCW